MLFMVIERFKDGAEAVRTRFNAKGRLMPEGLIYVSSWIDQRGEVCYQLVETANPGLFSVWTSSWDDLVDFEISPVMVASDFWAQHRPPS